MDKERADRIIEFTKSKEFFLNSSIIASKDILDKMIYIAEHLGLPASKAQLERYRDHYYKEEK